MNLISQNFNTHFNKSNKPLLIFVFIFFFFGLVIGWFAFFDTDKISPDNLIPIRIFVLIWLFVVGAILVAIMTENPNTTQSSETGLQINLFKDDKITDERLLIQKPKERQEFVNKSLSKKILQNFFGYGLIFLVFSAIIGGALFGTIYMVQNEMILGIVFMSFFDLIVITAFILPFFKKSPRFLTEIEFLPKLINIIVEKTQESDIIPLEELKEIKIEIKASSRIYPFSRHRFPTYSKILIKLKTITSDYALDIDKFENFQRAIEFKNKILQFCSHHYPDYLNQKKNIYEKSDGTLIIFFE